MIPSSRGSEEAQGLTHGKSSPKVRTLLLELSGFFAEAFIQHLYTTWEQWSRRKVTDSTGRFLSAGLGYVTWSKLLPPLSLGDSFVNRDSGVQLQGSWELWSEGSVGGHCSAQDSLAAMFIRLPVFVDGDTKNKTGTSQNQQQVPGRADRGPRALGDQTRAEACVPAMTALTLRASWISVWAQPILGVDSFWGDGQWGLAEATSRRLTIPGTKATGPFPASGGKPT